MSQTINNVTNRLAGFLDGLNGRPSGRSHSKLEYDATKNNGKRRVSKSDMRSEDQVLPVHQRKQVGSDILDLYRNFGVAAWAIRRHLDFVATWRFVMRTPDKGFNREVEQQMARWQRPLNCDATGTHPFPRLLRLTEAGRVYQGRCGLLGINPGQLQGFEGDQIRTKDGDKKRNRENRAGWTHGVFLNKRGRRKQYALHSRYGNGYEFERYASPNFFFEHAFYSRLSGQVAGVSPMTSAINALKDVYQGQDYALQKVKAAQLLGLVIYSDLNDDSGETYTRKANSVDADGDGDADDDEADETDEEARYEVDMSMGTWKIELEAGDKAEILQDKSPSTETVAFLKHVLQIALKSLDIPFNFYDEAYTNFFGSRAAWIIYERACHEKRLDVLDMLRRITVWLFRLWIRNEIVGSGDFRLKLPRGINSIEDIRFNWIPEGVPWWRPSEELHAELDATAAGLMNPYDICEAHGLDNPEDNWAMTLQFLKFAREEATREGMVDTNGDPLIMPLFNPDKAPIQVTTDANAAA